MQYLLNIGVAREGKSDIETGTVMRDLCDIGKIISQSIRHSETENTVVALVEIPGTTVQAANAIFNLSSILEQECIGVWNYSTGAGALIGPRADKWIPFNPEYLLLLDGSNMASHIASLKAAA